MVVVQSGESQTPTDKVVYQKADDYAKERAVWGRASAPSRLS
jgi:hypothetical protein